MRKLKFSLILCIVLCLVHGSQAQHVLHTQQLDNSSGLSNSCVVGMFQDSDNLLWVGTWDGLNVYNGTDFKVYNYGRQNGEQGLASNIIYSVLEDSARNVWAATIEGVSRIEKGTGRVFNYFYNTQSGSKSVGKGYLMAIDAQGNIYAASKGDSCLHGYNPETGGFAKVNIQAIGSEKIDKFLFDENNRLWLLKDNGKLDVYRKNKDTFVREFRYNELTGITDIFYTNHELFYTTTDKRLFQSDQQLVFRQVANLPRALRAITFYKGHYYLAWSSTGLAKYTASLEPVTNLPDELQQIDNKRVTSLLVGADGLLWIGTDGNGLIRLSERENSFGMVRRLPGGQPINIPVRAFCQVGSQLWVGTKGNGIITFNNLDQPIASAGFIKTFFSASDLMDNCVYSIIKGQDDLVYIGSDAEGLTVYDMRSKRMITWKEIIGAGNHPFFRSVHIILADNDGSVWLGTESFGLVHLGVQRTAGGLLQVSSFQQFTTKTSPNALANDVVYSLAKGNDGRIWIGCRYGGLNVLDTRTGRMKTFKAFSYDGAISNNDILALYTDRQQRLWVGTSYGLNWMPEAEGAKDAPRFNRLNMSDGLPNNSVHAITQDQQGLIWVSTNKGLAKIEPASQRIISYKESDGLQSNEFSDNAVYADDEGFLYFGGIYGFNRFRPDRLKPSPIQSNLMLTDIQMAGVRQNDNNLVVLNVRRHNPVLQYNLRPQDDFFELHVKQVTYSSQEKAAYAYKLEGNDKAWNYLTDDNRIVYTNLSPGSYTLKIKWTNGDGEWGPEVTALQIKVKQYFWLTVPAFALYFLLAFSGLYAFYRYKRNRALMKQSLELEHMLRKKDEEIHSEQLNFFTNIAHELQTPLTLISGSLERFFYKAKQSGKNLQHNDFLHIVGQQAARLTYLIQQLLEFRRAEAGFLKTNYTHLNVSVLVSNISSLFMPLSEQRSMAFECHIEENLAVWTDRDKLEKIIFNLLSNAFKHTADGEEVVCTLNKRPADDRWELVVANSGCSLSADECRRLFSKFFIARDTGGSKISSGIGLAYTRELVSLLNGDIGVTVDGGWIYFRLQLPLNFVPQEQERADKIERPEKPSYLIERMAMTQESLVKPVTEENNKKALMESLENDQRKSILIIEDEPSLRFLLNDLLKDKYIVYESQNGREAIELMTRIVPDLIISDIMMPDMDGLEVCNIVKNTPATCHIPFVILSARGTAEQKMEGYEAGADAYIPKPFQSEHLLLRIRKLLEYQQRIHDLFRQERVADKIPSSGLRDDDKQFLKHTIEIIEQHLEREDLDAAFIERELAMSKAQFYRKLKALSGMTPGELIKNIRLEKAASLLQSSELTVSEIFYKTGFNNQSHFFREFKKKYSASPSDFRAQYFVKAERKSAG